MVYKNTIDNRDIRGSGRVYIYEDERIPHFNITQCETDNESPLGKAVDTEWRQSKILKNDQIDFDVVRRWITVCKTEHGSKCNGHGGNKSPAKRLIDVEKDCTVDGSTVKEYLTLSYVWGMAAQFMLTKDVVVDSTKEGFFASLGTKIPQSIRDAMQVCRNIGVRYLWVDALCIVQDDDEDKKDQIGLMDEIYGRALAVLIVAAGDGADYGIPGMGEKKRALASYQETLDGKKLMTSLATTTFSAKRSQWNTRAWTYQEYILGNRLLVFTETYIFFKCSESMFRDDTVAPALGPLPSMPIQSDDEWILFTLNDISEDMDPKKAWKDYYDGLLAFYLRRNMTFDSDALPAFSGILKVLSKTLGPFCFGLPKKYFGRSLLWTDPHHGIFKRRADFPSWSWAGWKWTFEYFAAERSAVGAYGYKMPEETVPIQFFVFNDDSKLKPFFLEEPEEPSAKSPAAFKTDDLMDFIRLANQQAVAEPNLSFEEFQMKMLGDLMKKQTLKQPEPTEESMAEENERVSRLMSHLDPPGNYQELHYKDLISRHEHPHHLIAFYTSVATLKVPYSAHQNVEPGSTLPYDVQGRNGDTLFSCYIDPAWRDKQPESLEFVVIGLKEGGKAVVLMLLENVGGIYYRANWAWRLSQHLKIKEWMDQSPVQKLIIWG
ncbi:uncharacterized protein A1O5_03671 [Cladophialophora psammophila CBS 110553]|uniref:Heterokaryon incompatibility domain-containing protein n=1 Tax=Cladophialophora psammophila CBS 110553 TaxID=1182543 RepID=W9X5D0_9EURO|nr:uncharacterized protein A1O5_03671 [Cladophialophora psammophila CBS 110553]EXJ72525.1 hypothetical protein A1O5_03671 [Cladophialophora psammophila CBS 110553]